MILGVPEPPYVSSERWYGQFRAVSTFRNDQTHPYQSQTASYTLTETRERKRGTVQSCALRGSQPQVRGRVFRPYIIFWLRAPC